jgi:hypothetical protein
MVLFNSNISYGEENNTIVIIIDELDFQTIDEILNKNSYGAGFININTRKPYNNEGFYFSIATGRKVGIKNEYYKGLYKDKDGAIQILGFPELYNSLKKRNNIQLNTLGDKLEKQGIAYIGEDSSAIIAANSKGEIKFGETFIEYNNNWLKDKSIEYLSKSNILVLSYEIEDTESRVDILKNYIEDFKDYNIMLIPKNVSSNMRYVLNDSLVPVIYINGEEGLLKTQSTKREGFITAGDVYTELLSTQGEINPKAIGSKIDTVKNEDNYKEIKVLFSKTMSLIWIATIFHGIVYLLQCYNSYFLYKNRLDKLNKINLYNSFVLINIFISLVMGISALHINIFLYLFINFLVSYIITIFITEKEVSPIGLFSTLTYGIILFGIFFYPELIYNSYIGFNNLFYGARYYGLNNGIMGVLLVSSIISYFFIEDLIENEFIRNIICILYFSINMVALSASFGTNTGGFITSVILFLIMVYTKILEKNWSIKNITILVLIAILIFGINMYFDYHSQEKSHAISFLMRIRNFGFTEFIDMFKIKFKELIKWTILPPFSIVIIAQLISLKRLKNMVPKFKSEYYIIIFTALVGFILNDTGMITFIYMIHYLISLMIYENMDSIKN